MYNDNRNDLKWIFSDCYSDPYLEKWLKQRKAQEEET